jgi:dephospho-CoA kinase
MGRIAVTGGIASGKSAAAQYFMDLGVPVIDTDQIARALTTPV